MKLAEKKRVYVGSISGFDGALGDETRAPFYQVKLSPRNAADLSALLQAARSETERRGVTITVTYHDCNRLRVTHVPPPAYEDQATQDYLRGDVVRVTGKTQVSINLNMLSRFGVGMFDALLTKTGARSRNYILLRVPKRHFDLIEFVADTDLVGDTAETVLLGQASAALAGDVLPIEDFSDWEQQ